MNQHQFFMDVAKACARQSTCLRRRYGAVIIDPKTRHILSTGYNGQPSGKEHCTDKGWCLRDELNIPQGERYEICTSTHGEMNAICQLGRNSHGCLMYLYGEDAKTGVMLTAPTPCFLCTKLLLNVGIPKVIVMTREDNFIELDVNKLYDKYIVDLFQQHDKSTA